MGKMVRAVLFAVVALFSTAVFAEDEDPCAMPANLTEIEGVYQIGTCGDLYKFAEMVNGGEIGINGRLTADIDLNGSDSKQWTPIGTESTPYRGTFDGKDAEGNVHVISGLYFNDGNTDYVGLFGFIGYDAKVQNVGVVDSYIKGLESVGGVVGYNEGSVSNVYNTGAVSGMKGVGGVVGHNAGGTVSNVYNTGAVSGFDEVSGVVGYIAGGTVSNVYNTGMVSGRDEVGGVVGGVNNKGSVSNVYNTGTVSGEDNVGGVVGLNMVGTVSNVYNTGTVNGEDGVGGVVGNNEKYGRIYFVYYNTDFYTGSAVGINAEKAIVDDAEGKTTAELASTTLPAGFSGEIWNAGSGEPVGRNGKLVYKLPGLKNVGAHPEIEYTGFQPNADGFYEISNAVELKCFAQLVNSGATSINGRLTADICLNACGEGESVLKADGTLNGDGSNFTQWTPIGTAEKPYTGTFDGNGHTISGLYFNDENVDYVGLFGFMGDEAKVQNVGVVDSYILGKDAVGGVVGKNGGTVSNVYNTGAVSGEIAVGGVVGDNAGGVRMLYNTGAVSGTGTVGGVVGLNAVGTISNVYNTGAVSGGNDVGGVVGYNERGSVENMYNTGVVSGRQDVGGVVGDYGFGTVHNGYYNTEVSCNGCDNDYGAGKTTAELATLDVANAFDNSEGVWIAGEKSLSGGWLTYTFPSLKNVGTAQKNVLLDPGASEVEISNAEDLFKFAEFVNGGEISVNAKLTANICLNACGEGESVLKADGTLNGDGSNFMQWTPIGTAEKPYAGTFNGMDAEGNAHVISGLYFNDGNVDYVGLFGYIGYGAKVQNVGVVDSYIRGAGTVGGVAGYIDAGIVSNVYNTGSVSGADNVGGVVGYNACGTVSSVYNTGSVSGADNVGGVVGYNERGSVENMYNTGVVSGHQDVGGVVGDYGFGTVHNGYYNTEVSCNGCDNGYGTGKTTAELATLDVANAFDNSEGVWIAGEKSLSGGWLTYTFPSLKNVGTAPTVSVVDPKATEVEISNADELFKFAMFMNAGNTTVNGKLTADICVNACGEGESVLKTDGTLNGDGSNFTQWTPIGTAKKPYTGTFDGEDAEGNAHVISGLYFNDENVDYVGLFGSIGENAKVQNVGVVDSYIKGRNSVGGVVGHNGGTVSNVYNTGAVSGEDGVVGHNYGTVSNVYNTGAVSGEEYVGGVVGHNGGTVSNVYNTGAVSGEEYVGGVVGRGWRGIVSNVYNTGSVIGQDYVGGLVGENGGSVSNGYNNTDFYAGSAIGENVLGTNKNVEGKNSAELVAGKSLELDTAVWVLGGVGVGTTNDSLYYPYLKVFGPHKYVLGDVKKYTIAVAVNDKTMGTVTGAGTYEYGTKVEIKAVANEGYRFTDWEDDVKASAERAIVVTSNITYTANFEAIPSSSSEVESSSSVAESSSSVDESCSSEAVSSSSEAKSSSSEAKSSSSDAESSSSEAESSSSEAKSSSSEAKSSSSSAKSSSSSAKSSSSEMKSSSSEAKSSSSEAVSSSSDAKSSSSDAKSSSSDAKSSSSQKESIIAQAQLPQFSVTASGKMVSIAGARPNSIVNVFDMQGNMVKTVVATSANFTFALPSAGVYIVKNGYTAKRVNVR